MIFIVSLKILPFVLIKLSDTVQILIVYLASLAMYGNQRSQIGELQLRSYILLTGLAALSLLSCKLFMKLMQNLMEKTNDASIWHTMHDHTLRNDSRSWSKVNEGVCSRVQCKCYIQHHHSVLCASLNMTNAPFSEPSNARITCMQSRLSKATNCMCSTARS